MDESDRSTGEDTTRPNQNHDEETDMSAMTEEDVRAYWDERIHKVNTEKWFPTQELATGDLDWELGWE